MISNHSNLPSEFKPKSTSYVRWFKVYCIQTMEAWSIDEVCEFLKKHFNEVVRIFRANKICGSVLWSLNEPDMKELGLTALGDRRRLQCLIKSQVSQNTIAEASVRMV